MAFPASLRQIKRHHGGNPILLLAGSAKNEVQIAKTLLEARLPRPVHPCSSHSQAGQGLLQIQQLIFDFPADARVCGGGCVYCVACSACLAGGWAVARSHSRHKTHTTALRRKDGFPLAADTTGSGILSCMGVCRGGTWDATHRSLGRPQTPGWPLSGHIAGGSLDGSVSF